MVIRIGNNPLLRYNPLVAEREQSRALISSVPRLPEPKNSPGSGDAFKVTLSKDIEQVETEYVRKKGDAEKTYDRDRKRLENEFKAEMRKIESEYRRNKFFSTVA